MSACHSQKPYKIPSNTQSNVQSNARSVQSPVQPVQSNVEPNTISNPPLEMSPEVQKFRQFLEKMLLTDADPSPNAETIKTISRSPTKPAPQSVQKIILDAQPVEEGFVNAFDGRSQIFTTSKWPYSVHGLFVFKFNNIENWGTGTLIGPNIVLTAGHNLYSHKFKAYADLESMQFLPGINGQVLPFGFVEVQKYFISPNYPKDGKEDYGILILKEPIGEITGYFGLLA